MTWHWGVPVHNADRPNLYSGNAPEGTGSVGIQSPQRGAYIGREISTAETGQQSFRGAVLVLSTCDWDVLATAVIRRGQAAHCSHLRSRVSVGIKAPKGNQHRQQSARDKERSRPSGTMFLTLPDHGTSIVARHRSPGLCKSTPLVDTALN